LKLFLGATTNNLSDLLSLSLAEAEPHASGSPYVAAAGKQDNFVRVHLSGPAEARAVSAAEKASHTSRRVVSLALLA
jgi:hypothetical protein